MITPILPGYVPDFLYGFQMTIYKQGMAIVNVHMTGYLFHQNTITYIKDFAKKQEAIPSLPCCL